MGDIILYVLKKYGFNLSQGEAIDFINWYELNKDNFNDEDNMDVEARKYLYDKYKGKPFRAFDEDLSNMKYLLALLKKETEKK